MRKLTNYLLLLALVVGLQAISHAGIPLTDNFSSYTKNTCFADGANFGPWTEVFGDYSTSACVQVESNGNQSWLDESPAASMSSQETHASLVLGPSFSNQLTFSTSVDTVTQLRQGSAPNPWEVAWVLWHYADNNHFYYFVAKPNGWELGKEDPAYPGSQRFLATGSSPVFPIGNWYNIKIVETAQNTITVYVNDQMITTFTDTERPYTSGRIGLYNEDSHVQFRNVQADSTAATTVVSASGPEWGSTPFGTPQGGDFTAEMDATPLATTIDGGIGLSNGPQSTFTSLACIGRFNQNGLIDARNGDSYVAVNSISYAANQTYHFRFVVSLSSHTYSLYVTPPGQSEQTVALNYAFRTEQQSVTVLNNWSDFADIGSMQVSNFLAPSATSIANSVWTNTSFATQNGAFQASWDAMPMASGMDGVMAVSNGAQTSFPSFACLIRFFTDGTIQARNGGAYAADVTLSYNPNFMYHFRVPISIATHTYSVYVRPSGGSEQLLANNYAFRTEQAGVTALNNVGIIVDTSIGSLRIGNLAITGNTSSAYNQTILADHPVAFWNVNQVGSTETDLTGNGNTGIYQGGAPTVSTMPNGEQVAVFNGSSEYLKVPSNASFSIPTTGNVTWEMWIKPMVLDFPNSIQPDGYVNLMGKCVSHPNTGLCEWEARIYDTTTSQGRPNRLSAYVFNINGGEGSGADWQPVSNLIQANQWLHVVGEYTTDASKTPADCTNGSTFPGAINIWVNGVPWNQSVHGQTGCMGQFNVVPQATSSQLNIGTVDTQSWFEGAIGKVAIYNYLLSEIQITNHYEVMTGRQPTGSCGAQGTCTF